MPVLVSIDDFIVRIPSTLFFMGMGFGLVGLGFLLLYAVSFFSSIALVTGVSIISPKMVKKSGLPSLAAKI